MKLSEYHDKMKELEYKHNKEKLRIFNAYKAKSNALLDDYIKANNEFEVGDLFTDHIGTIKIKEIHPYVCSVSECPDIRFYGIQYTKKGEPTKRIIMRSAHQSNGIKNKG
jgi:hypothetical protein